MNYFKIVKDTLIQNAENRGGGFQGQVIVNQRALRMLVEDYERSDAYFRAKDESTRGDLEYSLHNVLKALYLENRSVESLILLVLETLKNLIEDKIKESQEDVMIDKLSRFK